VIVVYNIVRLPSFPEFTLRAETPEALHDCLRGVGLEADIEDLNPVETEMRFRYAFGVADHRAPMERRIAAIRSWTEANGHDFTDATDV
jgi:hypothetical protein